MLPLFYVVLASSLKFIASLPTLNDSIDLIFGANIILLPRLSDVRTGLRHVLAMKIMTIPSRVNFSTFIFGVLANIQVRDLNIFGVFMTQLEAQYPPAQT